MPGSSALIQIRGLAKNIGAVPLRVPSLDVTPADRLIIAGLDRTLAELFVHLITGAAVPDEGSVSVAGVDTRSIATDREWLSSLDRFGLVSDRAVLLESLPVAANLALPITLAIDPVEPETRVVVEGLAREVGLDLALLDQQMSAITPLARLRVHLARALANGPELLLLEDPTSMLTDDGARAEFGRTVRAVSASRPIGWMALTNDRAFITESGGDALTFDPKTGVVSRPRRWWQWGKSRGE